MIGNRFQILLTNDDGIQSPGLWAAAEGLAGVGYVTVAAPRDQSSASGRSMPNTSDGVITRSQLTVHGKEWTVFSVGGTPAQTVQFGVLEIMPQPPDLVVSGINYGENVGSGVTISGTVGAALEAASLGIPGIAISLETDVQHHYSLSREVDFSAAGYFAGYFARLLLEKRLLPDVDVLKVDVPADATPQTPWELTRMARNVYFQPVKPSRASWDEPAVMKYRMMDVEHSPIDAETDIHTLRFKHMVAVTPLSLDLTSRVDFKTLDTLLRR